MTGVLAHGGVGGAIVEIALLLTIVAVSSAVWRRERVIATDETTDEGAS